MKMIAAVLGMVQIVGLMALVILFFYWRADKNAGIEVQAKRSKILKKLGITIIILIVVRAILMILG